MILVTVHHQDDYGVRDTYVVTLPALPRQGETVRTPDDRTVRVEKVIWALHADKPSTVEVIVQ